MSRNYIATISMPMLEWVCVAAIPIYLCNNILRRISETTLQSTTYDDNLILQSNLQSQPILKSTLVMMGVTALLSLISLTNKSNRQQAYRGEGIVIGSHLIPIMYFASLLLHFDCPDTNHHSTLGLQHVIYSSCGGLAFIISQLRLQGRKKEDETSENPTAMMKLCWKVYLALLLFHQVSLTSDNAPSNLQCMFLGFLHVAMIVGYSATTSNTNDKRWQDAFTCGEWMVVSNLIASLIGDFILHHSHSLMYDDIYLDPLPVHARIAQAGLVGCLIGVIYCQTTSRILHQGIVGSLAGLIGILIGFLEMTLRPCYRPTSTSYEDWIPIIPRSFQWLLQFLSNEVELGLLEGSVVYFQRYMFLVYWGLVLIASIPLTLKLCKWVEANSTMKRRRVIIARKFFHLVAVILFTPITWIDQDMMALSYAIAITLLMILEIIRCYSHGRERDNLTQSLNAFYTTFLDEKDSLAANGGLAITHITLIVGCAMPLWMYQTVNVTDDSSVLVHLVPYLGVLVLGIGDSAGAIAGITFGRHHWPGASSRTLEGSLCMFVSMFILCFLAGCRNLLTVGTILAILTLLEASTTQIDNLCLPVAGTSLITLHAVLDLRSR